MTYICVKWKHSFPDEPILLYSELDSDRWEVRKIDVFPDGRKDYAGPDGESGVSFLCTEVFPPLEAMNDDPQFEASYISEDEFEKVWETRF